jgi:streptogramin lyase
MGFVDAWLVRRLVTPVSVVVYVGFLMGCSSSSPSTGSAASGLSGGSSHPSSSLPVTAPNKVLPTAEPITPISTISLPAPSGAIAMTTDGKDVWIGVTGAILRVDGTTGATTRLPAPAMHTDDGSLAIASDGLWLANHNGNAIERLDPKTGQVELTASAPGPVGFHIIGDRLWVGSEPDSVIYPVDRTTGKLGKKLASTFQVTAGSGTIWEGEPDAANPSTITRLDPSTGKPTATIAVPPVSGCGVGGLFPDEVWASCSTFKTGEGTTHVARIDPATNTVVTAATLPALSSVPVANGVPWFLVPNNASGSVTAQIIAVDPTTGEAIAARDLGAMDADQPVVTAQALWIPDEQGSRVLEFSLSSLEP